LSDFFGVSDLFGVLGMFPLLESKLQWTFEFRRTDGRERGTTIV
jgi:hypothetical protein